MTKHRLIQVPTHFKTDAGKTFQIKVTKVNIRSLWIRLMDNKTNPVIKVSRKSNKLIYGKEHTR